jgi:cupin 2 domain-containing protein
MNLFDLPDRVLDEEICETLTRNEGIRIERIVSFGQVSPLGFWYDQEDDEWVALIQGEAKIEWEGGSVMKLRAGDALVIPAHEKHRVAFTSSDPPCIWIAVFYKK